MYFQISKTEKEYFKTILDKTFANFFTFLHEISSLQVRGNYRFYHQKINVQVALRVAEQLKT